MSVFDYKPQPGLLPPEEAERKAAAGRAEQMRYELLLAETSGDHERVRALTRLGARGV